MPIAIDSVGKSYSHFAYQVEPQPDYLNIDDSILFASLDDEKSLVVTQSIIGQPVNQRPQLIRLYPAPAVDAATSC